MICDIKTIKHIFVFLCIVMAHQALAQSGKDYPYVVHLSRPNAPGYLTVNNVDGYVRIFGYNGKDVIIKSSLRNKNDFNEYVSVVNDKEGNGVIVSTDDDMTVDFEINVPYSFSITVNTDEGEIGIHNISGELAINSVNGEIRLTNISGYGLISTIDGRIDAVFSKDGIKGPFSLNSIDGKIEVDIPALTKVNLNIKSDSGDLYTDFKINFNINESENEIYTSKKSGLSRITLEEWLYGNINGGGKSITIKTVDGNIYLKKIK